MNLEPWIPGSEEALEKLEVELWRKERLAPYKKRLFSPDPCILDPWILDPWSLDSWVLDPWILDPWTPASSEVI